MAHGKSSESTEIDGLKFYTSQMDPLELYPMAPRILKLIAPILPYIGAIGGELNAAAVEKLMKEDVSKLSPILTALATALAEKENANLPQELLKRTQVSLPVDSDDEDEDAPKTRNQSMVNPKEINAVFRGRFVTMLKVMWWSLGVNFSDFFSGSSGKNPSKE